MEPIRKRLLKNHICVAADTVCISFRQTFDGRWPYLPGEVENLFRLVYELCIESRYGPYNLGDVGSPFRLLYAMSHIREC